LANLGVRLKFQSSNIQYIPVVEILAFLDLDQNCTFFKGFVSKIIRGRSRKVDVRRLNIGRWLSERNGVLTLGIRRIKGRKMKFVACIRPMILTLEIVKTNILIGSIGGIPPDEQ